MMAKEWHADTIAGGDKKEDGLGINQMATPNPWYGKGNNIPAWIGAVTVAVALLFHDEIAEQAPPAATRLVCVDSYERLEAALGRVDEELNIEERAAQSRALVDENKRWCYYNDGHRFHIKQDAPRARKETT